ncbi:putative baseplate assembly protein [Planotetraspora mira]|jgi:predicted phage baseplate assembly protein|uniref:Putative baseplate assembly protein n=1 Tax=Planotetraspora mira TaxID=58121 RepID=A0A8J3X5G8_9ACTN|nr:putative baseplate assembly protein [Planotetraspora mira]GII28161.1 putative baseplate assembly protein [Planotetraspora mira]
MTLPVPDLDDRRFQDLVDEAKRLVQQRCPEWTDHNVSDPGVTLIETFAFMVDQLLYRLNQVTDLHYLRYLELIGVRLFPPTAARTQVTYWLSAAQRQPVVIRSGAQIAAERKEGDEPVVFTTEDELAMPPSALVRVVTRNGGGEPVDRGDDLATGQGFACFSEAPVAGDLLYFGLSVAVPRCAVLLRVECELTGAGVDPRDPPLVWEAYTGSDWTACEVDRDTTGGLNRPGDVVLHVPEGHVTSVVGQHAAGWLRCVVSEPAEGQPFYTSSPRLHAAAASTIGGTVAAVHSDFVYDEVLGTSEGIPGQRFGTQHAPIISSDKPLVVLVVGHGGFQEWWEVASFAESGPGDRHIRVDRAEGTIEFGPAVREADGSLRQHGAVPPKRGVVRIPVYRTGGGRRGNVARNALVVQRDAVPYVASVTNRRPATGGVDAESVRDAAVRGPLLLRTRDRAVTTGDYEQLAREAAPDLARVRCVPVGADERGVAAGVRVLLVPAVPDPVEVAFRDLRVPAPLRDRVTAYLDERRCVGARVVVEPPFYQGITVVARLRASRDASRDGARDRALLALRTYLNPLVGGPDGRGWPFGRAVQTGEVFAVLQRVAGVELVEEVLLFKADPVTGERTTQAQVIDLTPNALVFSYGHQIKVEV